MPISKDNFFYNRWCQPLKKVGKTFLVIFLVMVFGFFVSGGETNSLEAKSKKGKKHHHHHKSSKRKHHKEHKKSKQKSKIAHHSKHHVSQVQKICSSGDLEKLEDAEWKQLVEKDKSGNNCFSFAVKNDQVSVLKFLYSQKPEKTWKGKFQESLVLLAAKSNARNSLEFLEGKEDFEKKDEFERTALDYAIMGKHSLIVRYLLEKPIDWKKLGTGKSTLWRAVEKEEPDIVKLLIQKEFTFREGEESETLELLVRRNNKEILSLLLPEKIKVQEKNSNGENALHFAARYNNLEIYKEMESRSVEYTTTNSQMTPLAIAVKNNHKKLVEYLLQESPRKPEKAELEKCLELSIQSGNSEISQLIKINLEKSGN